ncbi:MAG: SEC-C domain-containing protein [Bacteroidales bacterium]|nr:SEC-C domain-containing protein [Bacteroidales bacterium]
MYDDILSSWAGYQNDDNDFDESVDDQDVSYDQPTQARFLKIGRNEPCPCGSGKKYKKCCMV